MDNMRKDTEGRGLVTYALPREGIDVFKDPSDPEHMEIVWVSPKKCSFASKNNYTFRGLHTEGGSFQSDLMDAPDIEDTPELRQFLDNLFKINAPHIVGKSLGWFCAAFMTQIIRHVNNKAFPMLQIWGEAGAGKSATTILLANLHYYMHEPRITSSAGNTFYPMMVAVTQSASIPVIFEEMKPRQMSKSQVDNIQNLMRTNYTGTDLERGGVDRDKNSGVVIKSYPNRAPIAFLGEAVETQTAIQERCISVAMSKNDRAGCSEAFDYCVRRKTMMGILGKAMSNVCLTIDLDAFRKTFHGLEEKIKDEVGLKAYENLSRMIKTHVVVVTGLELLKQTLKNTFGDVYDARLDELIEVVHGCATDTAQMESMSEAAKTLDVLAQLTRVTDLNFRLEKNQDYMVQDGYVTIRMRPAYAKYVRYQTSIRQEVLFDNDRAFTAGMRKYAGFVTDKNADSPMFRTAYEPLFKFSVERMADDGCEPFD